MKVTMVLGTSTGGVGAHVRSLAQRLPAHGIAVAVAGPAETDEAFGFSAAGAVFRPVEIGPGPRGALGAVRSLRDAAAGSDVVHAHGLRAAVLTGIALGRRQPGRTPYVATWHNAVLGGRAWRGALSGLEALAARRADVTLGASSDLVERARELGAPDARLGPVAAPELRPASRPAEQVRAELGAGDRPVVLCVGRLAPQKDYDTLLGAAEILVHGEPGPLIAVAGDGPERARLQHAIDAGGLDVLLLGHRSDVPDLLAVADVYLLTSRWEARALVLQEAMAAGVPVVATAVGGVPELVGDAGLLVPPGDAAEAAHAVEKLLSDPAYRADLAERGKARAATWPDEDATARQVAEIYRELAARG